MSRKRCSNGGKVRHSSANRAMASATKAAQREGFIRVYQCPHCRGWHLTREPETEARRREQRPPEVPRFRSLADLMRKAGSHGS